MCQLVKVLFCFHLTKGKTCNVSSSAALCKLIQLPLYNCFQIHPSINIVMNISVTVLESMEEEIKLYTAVHSKGKANPFNR